MTRSHSPVTRSQQMRAALTHLVRLGPRVRGHLGEGLRSILEDSPDPQDAVVLAADDVLSRRRLTGLMSLARLFHRGEFDSSPETANAAASLLLESLPLSTTEVEQVAETLRSRDPLAQSCEILAGIALLAGGNRSEAQDLIDASGGSPLLSACSDVGAGNALGVAELLGERSRIGATFVEHFVSPALDAANAYRPDRTAGRRYGIVESLEAPPTAARSRRVSVWTFRAGDDDADAQRVDSIALVGHGDASTQRLTRPALIDVIERTKTAGSLFVTGLAHVAVGDTALESIELGSDSLEELTAGVRSAARTYGIDRLIDEMFSEAELNGHSLMFLATTPQAHGQLVREAIANAKKRTGRIFESASGPRVAGPLELGKHRPEDIGNSVPALLPILPDGECLTLQVAAFGGLPALDDCAEKYQAIIHSEREAEWRRRERRYSAWLKSYVNNWKGLLAEVEQRGREAVEMDFMLLSRGIDLRTATSVVYDPPLAITKAERMRDLPAEMLSVMLHLSWAKSEGESIRNRMGAPSAWQYTTLVDAVARGTKVRGAENHGEIEAWRAKWSPIVQACCDAGLSAHALDYERLVDSGQLVLRVLQFSGDTVDIEPLMIWDPFFDDWPIDTADRPHRRTAWELREPLVIDTPHKRRLRLDDIATTDDLASSLARRGTVALGEILEVTAPAFGEQVSDSERRRIETEALRVQDPVDKVFSNMRSTSGTAIEFLGYASDFFAAAQETGLPDCWAWGIHFVGTVVNGYMEKDHRLQGRDQLAKEPWLRSDPFQAVELLVQDPDTAPQLSSIFDQAGIPMGDIQAALNRLYAVDPSYFEECRVEGHPVASRIRSSSFGPGVLSSYDQYLYHLIKGEQAHQAAATLAVCSVDPSLGRTVSAIQEILTNTWPVFVNMTSDLHTLHDVIADPEMSLIGDATARQYISDAIEDLFEDAEMAYSAAIRAVAGSSVAIERLGELYVDRGEYAMCVERLIGERGGGLAAADLPLGLAVDQAGGTIKTTNLDWRPDTIGELRLGASVTPDGVTLTVSGEDSELAGKCSIGDLSGMDYDSLVRFFRRFRPDLLTGIVSGSADEWVRSVRVPALGWRGRIAAVRSGWIDFMLCCLVEERAAVESQDRDLGVDGKGHPIEGFTWSGRQACHRLYDRS